MRLPLPDSPIQGEDAMRALGTALAAALGPGDVLCLRGDLGAGKTTLVQGLAAGLGIDPSLVASPSFALVHRYAGGDVPLVHLDLYRLESLGELQAAGLDDALHDPEALVVVEWPDVAATALPRHALWLDISLDAGSANARKVQRVVPAW